MQITIGSKTYDAEPYHIEEATTEAFPYEDLSDPYRFDAFGSPPRYIRKRISPIDTRLIESRRRKVYEYNCLTRRGDTFDLDAQGRLRLAPVIHYLVQDHFKSGSETFPTQDLDLKKGKKLADKFRNDAGLPTKPGMSDPNQAVDLALIKQVGVGQVKLPLAKIKRKYISDVSFTVSVDVKYAYFRLKFGDAKKFQHVIVGLPRTVQQIVKISKVPDFVGFSFS